MKGQRKSIFIFLAILFASYFTLYSISPVCYAGGSAAGYDYAVSKGGKAGSEGIVVVWKLLLKSLVSASNEPDASSVDFIIKKARAVISPNNVLRDNFAERTAFYQPPLRIFFEKCSFYYDSLISSIPAQAGLHVLFSGAPPPSV